MIFEEFAGRILVALWRRRRFSRHLHWHRVRQRHRRPSRNRRCHRRSGRGRNVRYRRLATLGAEMDREPGAASERDDSRNQVAEDAEHPAAFSFAVVFRHPAGDRPRGRGAASHGRIPRRRRDGPTEVECTARPRTPRRVVRRRNYKSVRPAEPCRRIRDTRFAGLRRRQRLSANAGPVGTSAVPSTSQKVSESG